MTAQDKIDKYLEQTGQTRQELYAGAEAYGNNKILELVDECLVNNEKIIWKDEPDKGLGAMSFSLEKL